MGDIAASGGVWVTTIHQDEEIWAEETTLTGSIGVYSIIPDFSPLEKFCQPNPFFNYFVCFFKRMKMGCANYDGVSRFIGSGWYDKSW